MTAPLRHDNALIRIEKKVDRVDRRMDRVDRRLSIVEATTVTRKEILGAMLVGMPVLTGLVVAAVTIGERMWGQ